MQSIAADWRLVAAGRAATPLLVAGASWALGFPSPGPPGCVLGLAWLGRGGGLQKENTAAGPASSSTAPGTSSSTARRTAAQTTRRCRRTSRTIRTATFFSTTPRGGATPLPRRAQPLLLLFRSNPPLRGGYIRAPRPIFNRGQVSLFRGRLPRKNGLLELQDKAVPLKASIVRALPASC